MIAAPFTLCQHKNIIGSDFSFNSFLCALITTTDAFLLYDVSIQKCIASINVRPDYSISKAHLVVWNDQRFAVVPKGNVLHVFDFEFGEMKETKVAWQVKELVVWKDLLILIDENAQITVLDQQMQVVMDGGMEGFLVACSLDNEANVLLIVAKTDADRFVASVYELSNDGLTCSHNEVEFWKGSEPKNLEFSYDSVNERLFFIANDKVQIVSLTNLIVSTPMEHFKTNRIVFVGNDHILSFHKYTASLISVEFQTELDQFELDSDDFQSFFAFGHFFLIDTKGQVLVGSVTTNPLTLLDVVGKQTSAQENGSLFALSKTLSHEEKELAFLKSVKDAYEENEGNNSLDTLVSQFEQLFETSLFRIKAETKVEIIPDLSQEEKILLDVEFANGVAPHQYKDSSVHIDVKKQPRLGKLKEEERKKKLEGKSNNEIKEMKRRADERLLAQNSFGSYTFEPEIACFSSVFLSKLCLYLFKHSNAEKLYSPKVIQSLLKYGCLSLLNTNGTILEFLLNKKDWRMVQMALDYVPDVTEKEIVLVLNYLLSNGVLESNAEEGMRNLFHKVLALPVYNRALVRYLKSHLPVTTHKEQIVRLFQVVTEWAQKCTETADLLVADIPSFTAILDYASHLSSAYGLSTTLLSDSEFLRCLNKLKSLIDDQIASTQLLFRLQHKVDVLRQSKQYHPYAEQELAYFLEELEI